MITIPTNLTEALNLISKAAVIEVDHDGFMIRVGPDAVRTAIENTHEENKPADGDTTYDLEDFYPEMRFNEKTGILTLTRV